LLVAPFFIFAPLHFLHFYFGLLPILVMHLSPIPLTHFNTSASPTFIGPITPRFDSIIHTFVVLYIPMLPKFLFLNFSINTFSAQVLSSLIFLPRLHLDPISPSRAPTYTLLWPNSYLRCPNSISRFIFPSRDER